MVRPGLLMRAVWGILILATALVAGGLQLDREARGSVSVARNVPAIFAGYALETMAREAYRSGEDDRGLKLSKMLIERRPVPAESLGLLANGYLRKGNEERALRALLLSAGRGWRDRFTQNLLISASLQIGDYQVSAQRLIALWREGDRGPVMKVLSKAVFSNSEGLSSFENLISGPERYWATDFMVWAAGSLSEKATASLAGAFSRNSARIDCDQLSSATTEMVRHGKPSGALETWKTLCGRQYVTGPRDFFFRDANADSGPFDWRFPPQPGLEIWFESDKNSRRDSEVLHYRNSELTTQLMALRETHLSNGSHTVNIAYEDRVVPKSPGIYFQIRCYEPDGAVGDTKLFDFMGSGSVSFMIPEDQCETQGIALFVSRGEGAIRNFYIK